MQNPVSWRRHCKCHSYSDFECKHLTRPPAAVSRALCLVLEPNSTQNKNKFNRSQQYYRLLSLGKDNTSICLAVPQSTRLTHSLVAVFRGLCLALEPNSSQDTNIQRPLILNSTVFLVKTLQALLLWCLLMNASKSSFNDYLVYLLTSCSSVLFDNLHFLYLVGPL